jgi:hypothetical protein
MACGGRLTIALYTLRHVHEGEELTFDYSSVTESEKEFREAICLCGTHMCRGSYLYFTGSRAFMQVMASRHNMLHRQAILARAGAEPLTPGDRERVARHGLGESALGSAERGDRVPEWLEKWTALVRPSPALCAFACDWGGVLYTCALGRSIAHTGPAASRRLLLAPPPTAQPPAPPGSICRSASSWSWRRRT